MSSCSLETVKGSHLRAPTRDTPADRSIHRTPWLEGDPKSTRSNPEDQGLPLKMGT